MRMRKVASLDEVIISKSFANVRARTKKLQRLEAILSLYINPELKTVCKIAAYEEGTLTITTPHAAAASQIRYLSRIYIQQMRQHGELQDLKRINAVATRPHIPPAKTIKPAITLSENTVSLLESTAQELGDPELSEALMRLARHGRRSG